MNTRRLLMSDNDSTQNAASETESRPSLTAREQRDAVRTRYGEIAQTEDTSQCCASSSATDASSTSCCGDDERTTQSEQLGYTAEETATVAPGANLGLGCGNPTALASLASGETVLDLGSGGGFDCFLAAQEVGPGGHVIGVDMTPDMIERARGNIETNDADNVEFRLGEIEHLPIADERIDVIISNCVINLSPDKAAVFEEAYRVLCPGGRLAISDVVMTAEVPAEFRADPEKVAGCVAGAATIPALEGMLAGAGFEDVQIVPNDESHEFIREWSADHDLDEYIVSAMIEGRKPGATEQ
jgi:arsenite methyltransferase